MIVVSSVMVLAADILDPSTPDPNVDPDQVTPGAVGFAITFLVAAGAILLIIDMIRRIRRVNYRAQARAKIEAEEAALAAGEPLPDTSRMPTPDDDPSP